MTLSLQHLRIATDTAEEGGLLVFDDALLVAVLACLDAPHYENEQGHWHVEIGFGRCATRPTGYPTLEAALRWIAGRLGIDAEEGAICPHDFANSTGG